eukprot:CAMPEP_0172485962 /NCGR_PEP_ID=MMETSP1066-20121228/14264_1 /TAXON_ID=671091 /ORGANISM="Coscinodiscus wailesii, Strain CCMP2513" /LENGTH=509 /DNA_ID=CAMNT_0013251567 /DNA_START=113 /DNA_END=1642 /DNA_ORIENTATION=+
MLLLGLLVLLSSSLDLSWSFLLQKPALSNGIQSPRRLIKSRVLASKSSTLAVSDDARLKRISGLIDWAKSCEIKIGGVEISKCQGGLGLVATRDVNTNDVVMEVPTDVVVQSGEGGASRCVKGYDDVPWWAQLSLQLNALDKKVLEDNKSAWMETLPRVFNTPIHWDESSRKDLLQYEYMERCVNIQSSSWKKVYSQITPSFPMTYEEFLWGCECARSRAFSGSYSGSTFNPGVYAFTLLLVTVYVGLNLGTVEQAANGAGLVFCASIFKDFIAPKLFGGEKRYIIGPVLDMANHDSQKVNGNVALEYFTGGYSLSALRDLQQGEQVYITYGDRSNDQLLQYYGFIEKDNPNDVYVMPPLRTWDVSALEKASNRIFQSGRLEKLERAGLLGTLWTNEQANGVVISRKDGIDPAIMQALRALVSTDEEWNTAQQSVGTFAIRFSDENEEAARKAAVKALQLELEAMETTIEEDERMLKTARNFNSDQETLAILFRIEKKKVLINTIAGLS